MSPKDRKALFNAGSLVKFGQKLKNGFGSIFKANFWKKVSFEVISLYRKFQTAGKILSANERRTIVILSIIVLICAAILIRNYYLVKTVTIPQRGGVYTEGVIGTPKYLNPILARSEIDRNICRILFLPLLAYDNEGNLINLLASDYKVLDEGKKYDFTLNQAINWQDGERLTSKDVAFTLSMLQSEKYNGPFGDSFVGIKFEEKGEKEFSLILPEPNSSFPSIISELGILPEHKLREVDPNLLDKNEFNLNPVGYGGYNFNNKKSKNDSIVLDRSENYQEDKGGYFNQIVFRPYGSMAEVVQAYRQGEINGFGGFSAADIAAIDTKTFRQYTLLIPRFNAIFFNLEKTNLKELKLRQALARAIDKEKIKNEVYGGEAELLKTVIPSFAPGYNEQAEDQPYHLPTSIAYLDSLNYLDNDGDSIREKDGVKLQLSIYTTDDPGLQKIAESVKTDWAKVGVAANIMVVDLASLQNTIIPSHNYDTLILGENLNFPPDPYPFFHSSQIERGFNLSQYKNLAADTLLEDARLSIDPNIRSEKLKSFSGIVAEDLPVISIASAPYLYGANVSIKGIPKKRIAQNSSDRFLEIGSWYIKTERKNK